MALSQFFRVSKCVLGHENPHIYCVCGVFLIVSKTFSKTLYACALCIDFDAQKYGVRRPIFSPYNRTLKTFDISFSRFLLRH